MGAARMKPNFKFQIQIMGQRVCHTCDLFQLDVIYNFFLLYWSICWNICLAMLSAPSRVGSRAALHCTFSLTGSEERSSERRWIDIVNQGDTLLSLLIYTFTTLTLRRTKRSWACGGRALDIRRYCEPASVGCNPTWQDAGRRTRAGCLRARLHWRRTAHRSDHSV